MSASPLQTTLDRLAVPASTAAAVTGSAIAGSAVAPTVTSSWFATVRKDSITASAGQAIQGTFADDQYAGVRNQWIVQLTDAALQKTKTVTNADKLLAKGKLKVISGLGMTGWVVVDASGAGKTAAAQEKALKSNANVAYFSPNTIVQGNGAKDFVNDPRAGEQYALDKIDISNAWGVSKGSRNVAVAVLDSGVAWKDTDLAANMWRNAGEIAGNRRDDDGNGLVDDVYGWDFYANDSDPMDEHGHGTHVAGIIGAVGNNAQGIVGVNQEVSIMAVRGLGPDNTGSIAGLTRAINYVTMMKTRGVNVPIINGSWRSLGAYRPLYDAINAAGSQGILYVAAAGNDTRNIDSAPVFPASYNLSNIVSVASTDRNDVLASDSNVGVTSVDLAAPGVSILSTVPGNKYESWSGTSMAAPHVAGVAALAVAKAGPMPVDKLRSLLLSSVDVLPHLSGKVATGGRLNAARALSALLPGITISDVTAREGTGLNSVFRFTVSVSPVSAVPVSVEYATADGTARTGDSDYVSKTGRLEWAANDTTPRTIDILVVGDAKYETNENFSVLLRNAMNARIADGTGLGAIENDDPTPSIRIADARIVEGDAGQKAMVLSITLSNPSSLPCTVYAETANGSAIAGQDYVAIPPQTGFWFGPGETQKELTVNVIGDTVFEGDEFFYVRLSSPANCTMADGEAVGTIVDNESMPSLSIGDVTVSEGTAAVFRVVLSAPSAAPVTVYVWTTDGTATGDVDYDFVQDRITFQPGETTKPVTVQSWRDLNAENAETFFVNLTGESGASIGRGRAQGIITDIAPLSLSVNDVTVAEGKVAEFRISLSAPSAAPVTVYIWTTDGTAIGDVDFDFVQDFVTFLPGETTKSATIQAWGDLNVESSESFFVNLGGASGAFIGRGRAQGTILDGPPLSLSIEDVSAVEGTPAHFRIVLSSPSAAPVTFYAWTTDGTAIGDVDFDFVQDFVTLLPGQTVAPMSIQTFTDASLESTETFFANLGGANGASIARTRALATILDKR